jgi:arylsulfatase A-like enzyme
MLWDQEIDVGYRRLYHHLHVLVDRAIGRILDALDASGMRDDTIVVFTSDHGDALGAHGGLVQKWYNAFDETIRVPLVVNGPGVAASATGIDMPTSHVDLVPTLLGLAGIDRDEAAAGVAAHHDEVHPLPGRDLSGLLTGRTAAADLAAPVYFMTEDDITRGMSQQNQITGAPWDPVGNPSRVESVIAALPTGADGGDELWKLNRYYERLDEWDREHGLAVNPFLAPAAEPVVELHNLTTDPEERTNLADGAPAALGRLRSVLDDERESKRLLPRLRNPGG